MNIRWAPGFLLLLAAGCSTVVPNPAMVQHDPKLASQAHWIAEPANATATHDDFDELWEAAIGAARYRGYRVDRNDYRSGVFMSHPVVSKQAFEIWRRDVGGLDGPDLAESTLATMRRIVRIEISKNEDGTFACVPKVLVERYSAAERRITSVTKYRETFSIVTAEGSKNRDRGVDLADTYWYTTGRDASLEQALADAIRNRVKSAVASR